MFIDPALLGNYFAMTQGHDPVIGSNGLPGPHTTVPAAAPAAGVTVAQPEVSATASPVARPGPMRRARIGMRPSTLMLIAVWIAVLALYLAVRPGG
ncbi:hypothetical protein NONO_c16830 [Nocardia nova SH22a]|uniref:Uncharacterized protein n=1 Tax=Nocardia nova SH22a TaxID=1415166 RepID=W5TBG4_9NOCA|nr:hypothetical protein [Nocardia nova]AHH16484.1 hypothetical protein NONO_c16830 [Nocardia nova SH22a]